MSRIVFSAIIAAGLVILAGRSPAGAVTCDDVRSRRAGVLVEAPQPEPRAKRADSPRLQSPAPRRIPVLGRSRGSLIVRPLPAD